VQRQATQKESQSHQPKQMVQIPSASEASPSTRRGGGGTHPGRRVEAGQAQEWRVLCVYVCVGWVCRGHATNTGQGPSGERRMNMRRHQPKGATAASVLWPLWQGRAEGTVWCCKATAKTKENPQTCARQRERQGGNKDDCTNRQEQNAPMWRGEREGDVNARPRGLPAFGSMTRQRCGPLEDFVCQGTNALPLWISTRDLAWFVCVWCYDLTECRVVGGRHDRNIIGHHRNFSREPQPTGGCGVSERGGC